MDATYSTHACRIAEDWGTKALMNGRPPSAQPAHRKVFSNHSVCQRKTMRPHQMLPFDEILQACGHFDEKVSPGLNLLRSILF